MVQVFVGLHQKNTGTDAALAIRLSVGPIDFASLKAGMMMDTSGLFMRGPVFKGTKPLGRVPFRCFHRKRMYVTP